MCGVEERGGERRRSNGLTPTAKEQVTECQQELLRGSQCVLCVGGLFCRWAMMFLGPSPVCLSCCQRGGRRVFRCCCGGEAEVVLSLTTRLRLVEAEGSSSPGFGRCSRSSAASSKDWCLAVLGGEALSTDPNSGHVSPRHRHARSSNRIQNPSWKRS